MQMKPENIDKDLIAEIKETLKQGVDLPEYEDPYGQKY